MMIRFDIVKYFSYWCFGQFYDSRIKVLQIAQLLALVIFGSVSLMRQNLTELIERKFKKHKIQTLRWPLEAAKCSGVALSPSRKLISIPWGPFIYYVITFFGFLDPPPPPYVIMFLVLKIGIFWGRRFWTLPSRALWYRTGSSAFSIAVLIALIHCNRVRWSDAWNSYVFWQANT